MLGSPIAHSLSPALHQAAYAALGLDWSYTAHDVDAAALPGWVDGCDATWRGLSMTMPLKERVLSLGQPDPEARLAGGANTLLFEPDRRRVFNTDVGGLVDALVEVGLTEARAVVILGSGATARSALVSVGRLGAKRVTVLARTTGKAQSLLELASTLDLDLSVRPWSDPAPRSDLLISTVTAGAADGRAADLAASADVIFDVIYHPWPTALARAAAGSGAVAVSGLALLVHQAVRQIELMTGASVPAELLWATGRQALDEPEERLTLGEQALDDRSRGKPAASP